MMKKILRTPPIAPRTAILIPAIAAVVLSLFPILLRPFPHTDTVGQHYLELE